MKIKVIFIVITTASLIVLLPMTMTTVTPTLSNLHPANGATDVELTPTLHIIVNDTEDYTMNIMEEVAVTNDKKIRIMYPTLKGTSTGRNFLLPSCSFLQPLPKVCFSTVLLFI